MRQPSKRYPKNISSFQLILQILKLLVFLLLVILIVVFLVSYSVKNDQNIDSEIKEHYNPPLQSNDTSFYFELYNNAFKKIKQNNYLNMFSKNRWSNQQKQVQSQINENDIQYSRVNFYVDLTMNYQQNQEFDQIIKKSIQQVSQNLMVPYDSQTNQRYVKFDQDMNYMNCGNSKRQIPQIYYKQHIIGDILLFIIYSQIQLNSQDIYFTSEICQFNSDFNFPSIGIIEINIEQLKLDFPYSYRQYTFKLIQTIIMKLTIIDLKEDQSLIFKKSIMHNNTFNTDESLNQTQESKQISNFKYKNIKTFQGINLLHNFMYSDIPLQQFIKDIQNTYSLNPFKVSIQNNIQNYNSIRNQLSCSHDFQGIILKDLFLYDCDNIGKNSMCFNLNQTLEESNIQNKQNQKRVQCLEYECIQDKDNQFKLIIKYNNQTQICNQNQIKSNLKNNQFISCPNNITEACQKI